MADNKAVSAARGGVRAVRSASTPATVILFLALFAGIAGRWAHGKKLPSGGGLLQIVFALIVITALDRGETRPIARGFAWLFLAVVLLGPDSPITALVNANNPKPAPKPAPKKGA
jgi:hypothetical protein